MKNNSQTRNKSKYLTNIGFRFLLLCILLTSHLPKVSAENGFMLLQSTDVTLNLTNVSLETLFKTLEKKSNYVFFFKEDVLQKNEKVTVKAQNESVVSILNRILPPRQLTYTVKGRQVIIVRLPQKEEKKAEVPVEIKEYTVKGTVVDASGQPLPGVNITVQGTTNGVTTDLSGGFTLRIRDGKRALLVASYIGFSTRKVWVSGETNSLKIMLEESSASLNEVVVVGYGTQKKLNLTGAVTTASGEILENRPIANIAQGLQGMVPNLNITFNSGQPNEAAKINIRGNTSLNGGNALILVDGVEISDLSLINPQDVESVSVLKDASAAAVYGARAAFGVMLVTTKKGNRNQKTRVTYNNNLSWSSPARLPEMPRSDVWARMWNKAYEYDTPGGYYFNEKFMEKLDAHIADPEHNPAILVDTEGIQNSNYSPSNPGWAYVGNTDWLSEFYQKSAFMQQHNVSLSGGTERNNYYASIGFKDQSGIFRYGNDSYKRFNLAFSFDTKLTNWLDVSFVTRMSNIKNDEPYMDNGGSSAQTWYYEVYRMYPTLSIFLPNGDFAGMYLNSGNYNVIGKMALAGRNKKETWDQWYIGRFDLHPLKGLSIKDYSWNRYSTVQKFHRKEIKQTFPEGGPEWIIETPNYVRNYNSNNIYHAINVWAEYKTSFNDVHNISVMGGYNQEEKSYANTSYTMTDLYDNELPISDLAINYKDNAEGADIWRVQGAFFRLNYDYRSKYLLEVNGRYDGSSKYAKDDRWAFFPSASIGWRISEEKFFEPLSKVVDNLKLRASVGALGNQITNGYHDYMSILSGKVLTNYMMDGKMVNALNIPSLPSVVTWEKVVTKDLGLDWSLFNNRLMGTFDFYVRDTKDMVRSVTLPAVLGTSGGKENIADMRTTGWELELTWKDRIKNVLGSPMDYSLTVGLSDYQAEITKYDNPNGSLAGGMYYEGQKLGEIWGYVTDRLYTVDDFDADGKLKAGIPKVEGYNPNPGDILYKDLDDNDIINGGTSTTKDPGDRKIIGNSTRRYQYGIHGGANWKGVSLSFLLQGVGKRDLWIMNDLFYPHYDAWTTVYDTQLNYWTPERTDSYFPRLYEKAAGNTAANTRIQTRYLQDGSYLSIRNITLSYNFPSKWMTKIGVNNLAVFFSGENLYTFDHLPKGLDPERSVTDDLGQRGFTYPYMRQYSFGINLSF